MPDSSDAKQRRKCADCGFLTVHGTVNEVDKEMRRDWPFDVMTDSPLPSCYEEAFPLKDETHETPGGRAGVQQGPRAVITKERACSQFTRWLPHKTPEEHRQMLHDKELREEHDEREERNQRFLKEQADAMFRRNFITIIVSASFGAILTATVGWLTRREEHEKKDPVINIIMPAPEKPK